MPNPVNTVDILAVRPVKQGIEITVGLRADQPTAVAKAVIYKTNTLC